MLLDKNGKLFGKINIIDIAAVLLVIVFCAGIAIRVSNSKNLIKENTGKCRFTVKIEELRREGADAVIKGDTLSEGVETVFGEITDVRTVQMTDEIVKADGTKTEAERPDKYTVYATVELDGKWKDGIFYCDKDSVGPGGNFWVITKHVKCIGKIVSEIENIS